MKCFRYPGWRLGWAVGPRAMITSLGCAASAVDGGPGQPVQRARTHADERFRIAPDAFRSLVEAQRLDAYLMSNPCNPTGQVVQGEALAERLRVARAHDCTLILDEFYSHFIYTSEGHPAPGPVSAARYVEDVSVPPMGP